MKEKDDNIVTYWMGGRKGILSGIPPGHAASFEWMWKSDEEIGKIKTIE